VLLLEGGAGWLPFVLDRIEFFEHQRPEVWSPPSRARTPRDIICEQVAVSFIDERRLPAILNAIPATRVLWQCDFPHADSPWPHSRARLSEQMVDIGDDAASLIAGGNASALHCGRNVA
jgi:hypothetical protein